MAVVIMMFVLTVGIFAALCWVCRVGVEDRNRTIDRQVERRQVPCDDVVASAPAARQGLARPALSEDDVIAFGLALEAASDVMDQLRTKRREPRTVRALKSDDKRR